MQHRTALPRGGNADLLSELFDQQRSAVTTGRPVDPKLLAEIDASHTPPPPPFPKQAPPPTGIYSNA